jgi:hypothetical protein
MGGAADMKFLRAYFAGVISCFISHTMSPSISPRCYTSLFDLNQFHRLNFAQFAIDQIIAEVKKMGVKKKYVCCCLHHLVVNFKPNPFFGIHTIVFSRYELSPLLNQIMFFLFADPLP